MQYEKIMGQQQAKNRSVDPETGKKREVHYVKKHIPNISNVKKSNNANSKSEESKDVKKKKKLIKVPENPLNSYIESYLRRLFKKFDLDKDNNLNPKEMKNLIIHLTGRKISKAQTKLFLESIDENNDALIQRLELEHFVKMGINLTEMKRKNYAKRSKLHSIILDFFDACQKNLQKERDDLHVDIKLTSSDEEGSHPYYSAIKGENSSDESSEYERHFVSDSENGTISTQYSFRVGSVHSSNVSMKMRNGEKEQDVEKENDDDIQSNSSDEYGTRYSIYLESVKGENNNQDGHYYEFDSIQNIAKAEIELKDIFDDLDEDGDGQLQVKEFHKALFRRPDLGTYIRPKDVRTAFAILGIPLGQSMSFPDFQRFCLRTREKHHSALQSREALTWITNLRSLFWRLGADRYGHLPFSKLRRGLLLSPSLGHLLKAKEIDIALGKLHVPQKGLIQFHNFKTFCLQLASTKRKGTATRTLKLVTELQSIFESLDINKSGTLEVKELHNAFFKRPDIARYIRPAQLRETFIAMSIPSNGHVTYDQFERCVLAASGGIQPEPDIILDNLSSSSSSDDGQNTNAGRSSSSASDDERSYSDSGRASNTSEISETTNTLQQDLSEGFTVNFSAIALTDYNVGASQEVFAHHHRRKHGRRHNHKHHHHHHKSVDNRSNFALEGFDMDDEGNLSVFSYQSSNAGKSRWSMQSHTNSEELYEHNAPDLVMIGSSSSDHSIESDGYDLDGHDMDIPGDKTGEHVQDFELVDDD